jgi:hypothetical protein
MKPKALHQWQRKFHKEQNAFDGIWLKDNLLFELLSLSVNTYFLLLKSFFCSFDVHWLGFGGIGYKVTRQTSFSFSLESGGNIPNHKTT